MSILYNHPAFPQQNSATKEQYKEYSWLFGKKR
jgi:hypothetical protein